MIGGEPKSKLNNQKVPFFKMVRHNNQISVL